jgi:DNA (cytosine-5)-methyltransferase 1
MKKIKIFETFSGIGAQTKAFKNILKDSNEYEIENVGISEWYIDAIIAYAKIHHLEDFNKIKKKIEEQNKAEEGIIYATTKKEIIEEYEKKPYFQFSSNSKTLSELKRIKEDKIIELYIANNVNKNYGSISEIKGKEIPKGIDIFTYSFPCQALSLQGKQGGLAKNSGTTSSLVWQVLRLLGEAKEEGRLPKVLLMENVKALFSKKFINTWTEVKEILNEYGYNTYDTIINAVDKGSIQRRERVFAISVLKEHDIGFKYNNLDSKKNNKVIKNILESKIKDNFFMKHLEEKIETEEFRLKPSGICSLTLQNYTTFQSENILYSIDGKSPTLTASGANSRIKIIDKKNDLRYLTPIEFWQLMGFEKNDLKPNENLSNATLYRLAGNSISVEVLEDIFEDILKLNIFK